MTTMPELSNFEFGNVLQELSRIGCHEMKEKSGAIAEALEEAAKRLQQPEPENKPLTNSDRIRNMTDEELAKIFVSEFVSELIPFCQNKPECDQILDAGKTIPDELCVLCALDWLRRQKDDL